MHQKFLCTNCQIWQNVCGKFWQICQILRVHILSDFCARVLADLSEKFSGQKNFLRGMLAGEFSHHKNIFFVCGEKIRPGIYVDDDFFIDDA